MHFTEHHLILFLFRISLFLIALGNGYHISRSSINSIKWTSFLPTIIAYTLYAGLRWGRGTDYNLYYWIYNDINKGIGREDNEPLFVFLIKLFGNLGLEWQHFVAFMSFLLIFSVCYFLKRKPKISIFTLPILVLSLTLAENLMRWYLGFSFVLIGLFHLLNNEQKKFLFFSLLGFLIHYGLIINIAIFYLVWIAFKENTLHPIIAFSLYLTLYFIFDPQFMGHFADVIQQINLGTRFIGYQNNAEAWLTGDANDDVRSEVSILNIVRTLYLIYTGYHVCKKNKSRNIIYLYNLALIGWVFNPAALQIEIAIRINALFLLIGQIYMAYIYYDIIIINKKAYTPLIKNITLLFLIYTFYAFFFKSVFSLEENNTLFIWDAAGRAVLPI